jgi:hypothetical protein
VGALTAGGYTVLLEDTTGERAWRTAKERGIDVVIIDGQKKPSHGRQTGYALRDTAKTRNIPIIWTNLDTEDGASVETEVHPDVVLPAPTDASGALSALQALGERITFENGALFDAEDEPDVARPTNGAMNGHSAVVVEEVFTATTTVEVVFPPPAPPEAPRPAPEHRNGVVAKAPAPRPAAKKKVSPKRTAAKSARAPKRGPAPKKGRSTTKARSRR